MSDLGPIAGASAPTPRGSTGVILASSTRGEPDLAESSRRYGVMYMLFGLAALMVLVAVGTVGRNGPILSGALVALAVLFVGMGTLGIRNFRREDAQRIRSGRWTDAGVELELSNGARYRARWDDPAFGVELVVTPRWRASHSGKFLFKWQHGPREPASLTYISEPGLYEFLDECRRRGLSVQETSVLGGRLAESNRPTPFPTPGQRFVIRAAPPLEGSVRAVQGPSGSG